VIGWLVNHYSYVPVFVLAALLPQIGYLPLTRLIGTIEPVVFDACLPADVA